MHKALENCFCHDSSLPLHSYTSGTNCGTKPGSIIDPSNSHFFILTIKHKRNIPISMTSDHRVAGSTRTEKILPVGFFVGS